MTLVVALVGEQPSGSARGLGAWGSWAVHSWTDPAGLATDPVIDDPRTRRLLVLSETTGRLPAEVAASTVAATRPDIQTRVHALPYSLGVLARALELMPTAAASGNAVHEVLRRTLAGLTWGAWLPTVAKLERPAPTLAQHVASWLPRADGYLAVHGSAEGDPGWVRRLPLDRIAPEHQLSRVPAPGVTAAAYECHAYGDLPEPAIAALFGMGLASRPVRREPISDLAATWGTPKAVEFVISRPVSAELELAPRRCPSCFDPVWSEACVFCRVRPGRTDEARVPAGGAAR